MNNNNLNSNVFSPNREVVTPALALPEGLHYEARLKMDGLDFLARLPGDAIPLAFLDPQYRGVLDKLAYGNEGRGRGRARAALQQMDEEAIANFIQAIDRVLAPGGHLFLWLDKFHLCTGFAPWLGGDAPGRGGPDHLGQGAHGHGLPYPAPERVPGRAAKGATSRQRRLDGPRHSLTCGVNVPNVACMRIASR